MMKFRHYQTGKPLVTYLVSIINRPKIRHVKKGFYITDQVDTIGCFYLAKNGKIYNFVRNVKEDNIEENDFFWPTLIEARVFQNTWYYKQFKNLRYGKGRKVNLPKD